MVEIKMLSNRAAEVYVYGDIGWDTASATFAKDLGAIEAEEITVRINSPGGDVYEGLAIMNALRGHPARITAVIEGLAASAASFIAVGGSDHVIVRPQAEIMIHDAMSFVGGNAAEMQRAIADLDRVSDSIAGIYAEKAGGEAGDWRALMQEETWYSAEEAVAAGLADVVEDARQPAEARARVGVFNLTKFKYPGRRAAPSPVNHAPPGRQEKGSTMDILKQLAQAMGKDEAAVRNALTKVLNEQIEVTSVIELTYPEGTTVVPTGRATITPEGEVPQGLVFALGDAPEGWTAEVDETTGVVTVTAPSGAEPDDEVQLTVTVQGNGDPVEFPITVTVKSAAGEDDDTPVSPGAPTETAPGALTQVVDSARLAELEADAAYGREARKRETKNAAEKLVNQAVADGKIGAAARPRWIDQLTDPATAEDAKARLNQIRPGLVHRSETGHTQEPESHDDGDKYTALVNAFGLSQ